MRTFLLDGGTMMIDRSQLLWNVDPGTRLRFPVYSVLVEHPEGLFLFDTGYDLEHVRATFPREEPRQEPRQGVVEQLALCGFAPGDVTHLVNSHLHFDHVGGNRHFPGARRFVARDELRQAMCPEPFERLAYSDRQFEGAPWELLDGEVDLADGLLLVPTPGHSAGHYSLLVTPPSGAPLLFAFDAAYSHENLDRLIPPGFHHEPTAAVASLRRLRRLAERHGATMFVAHDAVAYAGYRLAPDAYGGS